MDLIKLVEVGLAAEGFDGLYVSGVCGCLAGELSPGSCIGEDCSAGYKHTHSATGEWIVGGRPKSEGYSDREIENILADCGEFEDKLRETEESAASIRTLLGLMA